ncbi:helix-turn-helix domain-containing protein [Bifidobacterium simiiventris]|uniref:helix-turn-helix domain-containing protein n=1 Tax=Bifidobacterium simiiventris TaxID=2834434 RepID=UPI001C57A379|nr:helix-turn-helix transcriptional regulator [Bifidobacterium simiiventris]MBW3077729.1 helix-turn-helix transcriptional regulator [Bifidobacterium simiiventris]
MTHMPTGKKTATIESKTLSIAIKRAMAVRNIKTRALADESGVPYGTLRRILELNTVADYEQLRKLADALRTPLSSIIADAERLTKDEGVIEDYQDSVTTSPALADTDDDEDIDIDKWADRIKAEESEADRRAHIAQEEATVYDKR